MKKSNQVPATLITALAAGAAGIALGGCGSSRDCKDASGNILPNNACSQGAGYRPGAHWVPRVSSGGFSGSGSSIGG